MNYILHRTPSSGIRVFSACLLSFLLIMMPFVQLAAAASRSGVRNESSEASDQGSAVRTQSSVIKGAHATAGDLFVNPPVMEAAAPPLLPNITATKTDNRNPGTDPAMAAPGDTITYTVTISNTGTTDATGVTFNDTVDAHTTLVPGSVNAQPIALDDSFNVLGNVQIQVPDGASDLLGNDCDPDVTGGPCTNTGLTITTLAGDNTSPFAGTSTQGGNVTASTNDGSFQYNPAPGFAGTDTFTYTTSDAGGKTDTATVTLTVGNGTGTPGTNVIWFINPSAPAGGDGRLTKPFNCYTGSSVPVTGPTCFSDTAADDPGDTIFLFSGAHTGGYTLLNNEKLIGAAATDTLVTITGFTVPTHSDALPATGGVSPTMTTSAASTNAVNLGQGNTLRGFTVGNTTGAKIFGNNFGTATVGKLAAPDMILNGTGQALNLTTGTFAATSAFTSVTTTSSPTQGIILTGIAGTVAFGSTTVSGSTSQGILVGTTTADINFGNTSVSGGTDGISFQNNSSGTRTIGTLSISNNSLIGFVHAVGGGNVTVTGATTIPAAAQTAPVGTGIDIQGLASGTSVSFAATTVNKGNAGTAVNLGAIATPNVGNVTFNSLSITTSNGAGLVGAANTGQVDVTTNAGSIAATGGPAINITKAAAPASPISLNFTTVSSTNSTTQGVNLDRVSGNMTNTTTTITNPTGVGIQVQNTSAGTMNFGNTTANQSGGTGVVLGGASSGNAGNVTFADLDINPDSGQRALQGTNNTGTITSTSGDVQATSNVTLDIVGASAIARTPLAMTLNNLDSTNSSGIGVNLNFVSGNFTVNDGTLATSISNPTGVGIQVLNTGAGTVNFGNTNVASNGGTGVVLGTAGNGNTGAITFADLDITPDSGQRGLHAIQNTGAITIGSGSTVATTNNTAVEITGVSSGSRTPLNVQFTSINTTGGAVAANGILLQNTSATGAPGGFRVLGNAGACDAVTTTCTGGRITNTTGADGATGGSGVYMDTVDKVVLTRMRIDGHTNFGVRGLTVTGFTMDTCLVDGANGSSTAADEGSVIFDGLFGTAGASTAASITASTIKGGVEDNFRINNTSGTLEVTITTSTIRDSHTTSGNDNVNIRTHGSANINAHITNSTFATANGDHIQTIADEQSTLTIVVTGNTLSGGAPSSLLQGITISGGTATPVDSTEVVRFNISNNTMSGTIQGGAININEGSGNGNWQGQISTNTIGTIGSACSGATQSSGIRLENHSKGSLTGLITNNIVNQTCGAGGGIVLSAGDNTASGLGNGPLNATVTGNTVDVGNPTSGSFDHGIVLCGGCGVTNNTNLVCLDLKNNTSEGSHTVGSSGFAYRIRQRFSQTVRLPGYGGANNDNAAVIAYLSARPNTAIAGDGGTYSVTNTVGIAAPNGPGGGFVNTPGGAQCTQPIVPSGPEIFIEGGFSSLDVPVQTEAAATTNAVTPNQAAPRFMWAEIPIINLNPTSFDSEDKDEADEAEKAKEEKAKDNSPTVNPSEAQTKDNSETVTPPAAQTNDNSMPAADSNAPTSQKSALQTTSKRRKPSSPARTEQPEPRKHHATSDVKNPRADADQKSAVRNHVAATRALMAPMSGEAIGPIIIGTLRPSDSVTITFQVTVNNPPNLTLLNAPGPRVSNQGSVSGSNFAIVQTDDPDVVGTANATETLIDLFNTSTGVISSLNPSESGDAVTFTATVSETPVQGTADPTGTVQFLDGVTPLTCTEGGVNGIRPVSGGTAACTTSALSSGPHTINANYSGDGNFEASSGNVSQTVNTCTSSPVVTKIADTNDGTCDADCSLREAIATACSGNTITFNTAGVFATPQTITLTLGELSVARNVTIDGPDATGNHVTVSGGGASRVFNISPGKTVTIRELTVTGASTALTGGGIFNDHGALTLINMTISGNTAAAGGGISVDGTTSGSASLTVSNSTISGNTSTSSGGGIYSLGTGGAATLIITNSTISGNNADLHGGGLYLSATTSTLTNVTVTNNRADNDNNATGAGGGLGIVAGATTTLHNTIVASNFNEDGGTDARDDINGALDAASSFNLIGDGTNMTGITHGTNGNQVGTGGSPIDAMLGALVNNGGPTFTHALLPTSPAVETGSNTAATNAGLTTDQRGTGFPRIADSADANTTATVDIGAYELHPTIEDIPDKSTPEDTGFNFNFNIGDDTGALITSVTATSGNATLVPNANLIVTGSGGTRNLAITPAADANSPADGTATITVTVTATNGQTATDTFVLTVTEVNDTPDAINDSLTAVDEDSGLRIIPFADLLTNDTNKGAANESGQTLNVTAVSNPVGGTVQINGTNVEFTVAANFSGTASFDYTATDNGTTNAVSDPKSDTATASFTVNSINDPPSFTIAGNPPAVNEDAGAQTVNSFATSISQGAGGETGQTLTFNITPNGTTGNISFASGPAIDSTTGNLTYTTNTDTNGTATFDVTLSDNGGTLNGGQDTSAAQSFTITVNAVNDAPTFQIASNPAAVDEDAGAQTVNSFATNFQPGPVTATDEGTQTLAGYTVTQTGSTGNLSFSSGPSIDNAGTLTYTPAANTNGTMTFDAVATDSGLGSAPNVNQSAPISFTITVNAVNDEPSFTAGPNQTVTVSAGAQTVPGWATNIMAGPAAATDETGQVLTFNVSVSGTTGTLTFVTPPAVSSTGTLTYHATNGTSGTATVDVFLTDNGSGLAPNDNTSPTQTFTITVGLSSVSVQDAKVAEPTSGTTNMVFTVTLNAPAPAGGASVNFTTADEPAGPGKAVSGGCPGFDYTTTSGTISFAMNEQVKTINVPVCSDADNSEPDETFLVNLSSPTNAQIVDGTATGTITVANPAGTFLISELRTSGPNPSGSTNEFVELYNNTDTQLTIAASDASAGYGLYKMGSDCNATPILIGTIPNGTVIPARGHFLFVGATYGLADYGGTNAAAGDATLTVDIENDANVAIFNTANVANLSTLTRLDAVGFGLNTGSNCDLLREGSTLPPVAGSTTEHSFFRKLCDFIGGVGCSTQGTPKDTNNNSSDFLFADTLGTIISGVPQRLGAPGPENKTSPIKRDPAVNVFLLDSAVSASAKPNRDRDTTADSNPANNSAFGTMKVRRRVFNNTGAPVTRLRFRVVEITTLTPPGGGQADLRLRTSVDEVSVGPVNDATTCTAAGAGAPPCSIPVMGLTLEQPPTQPEAGGYNSTVSAGTITMGSPLAPGASLNVNFLLGVEVPGIFRFYIIVEALP